MFKLKALNESKSDDEDDDRPVLRYEVQEAQLKQLYSSAQMLTYEEKVEEAIEKFELILEHPLLNDQSKPLSTSLKTFLVGSLKCLGTLYSSGVRKDLSRAVEILSSITVLEPGNVTSWYRLGKAALENCELEVALQAFACGLEYSPNHWGCIDNLILVSYLLDDFVTCKLASLKALNLDPTFLKARLFLGEHKEKNPWLFSDEDLAVLNSILEQPEESEIYQLKLHIKQLKQRWLKKNEQKNTEFMKSVEEHSLVGVLNKHLPLSCNTLCALCEVLFLRWSGKCYSEVVESPEKIQISNCPPKLRQEPGPESGGKDTAEIECDDTNKESNGDNSEDKNEETTQSGFANSSDVVSKRRNKKAKQWWQTQGQRKSPRVKLIPSYSKPESSFADSLKNILRGELLCEDEDSNDKNDDKSLKDNSQAFDYFGTAREEEDVNSIIADSSLTFPSQLSKLMMVLCQQIRAPWNHGIQKSFSQVYKAYKTLSEPLNVLFKHSGNTYFLLFNNVEEIDYEDSSYKTAIFAVLTRMEIYYEQLEQGCSHSWQEEDFLLEELHLQTCVNDQLFYIRYEWMKAKFCMADSTDSESALGWLHHLSRRLDNLGDDFTCLSSSLKDHIISRRHVQEKIHAAKKLSNVSRIDELYEGKEYEALLSILKLSVSDDDYSLDDVQSHLMMVECYILLRKPDAIKKCVQVCETGIKYKNVEVVTLCVYKIQEVINCMSENLGLIECKKLINILVKILIFVDKYYCKCDEDLIVTPWCLLHELLFRVEQNESDYFIDDENVPSSILALQMGHETLAKFEKCCSSEGQLLRYTLKHLMSIKENDSYWAYEETKQVADQAIFCMYGHPKKSKKNLKTHVTAGEKFDWNACCLLFSYYRPKELPEFDSRINKTITLEVEGLYRRIVSEIPSEYICAERHQTLQDYIDGKSKTLPDFVGIQIPTQDIYYCLADHYFKNQEMVKAVDHFILDLTTAPLRFDSWTGLAMAKAEEIFSALNGCIELPIEDVMGRADAVIRCYSKALNLDSDNHKVRIEYGTFLYSLHSVYSRELKGRSDKISMDTFEVIEDKKQKYLLEAKKWFEPLLTSSADVSNNEDAWVVHYMLGKIYEKLYPHDIGKFLKQYELAADYLHKKDAPYPAKISYYSPPEYALESLEIFYRINASILRYIETLGSVSEETEKNVLKYLENLNNSPFIKNKSGRGSDKGDNRVKKQTDETLSKKEMAEVNKVVNDLIQQVEIMLSQSKDFSGLENSCSATSPTSLSPVVECPSPLAAMPSWGLSAFRDKIIEMEKKEKLAEKSGKQKTPEDELSDFSHIPYGKAVNICVSGLKECISRYPQFFKAYYQISNTYLQLKKDPMTAKCYMLGKNMDGSKIPGLFSERRQSNFFHGIWRSPVDDFDRPGSFPYHMAKCVHLLITVLRELNDHQMLAELGFQLMKEPDPKHQYLRKSDRVEYSNEALQSCAVAAKRFSSKDSLTLAERGNKLYDTYNKFSKNSYQPNPITPYLVSIYKQINTSASNDPTINITLEALKYFQHVAWTQKSINSSKSLTKAVQQTMTKPGRSSSPSSTTVAASISSRRNSDKSLSSTSNSETVSNDKEKTFGNKPYVNPSSASGVIVSSAPYTSTASSGPLPILTPADLLVNSNINDVLLGQWLLQESSKQQQIFNAFTAAMKTPLGKPGNDGLPQSSSNNFRYDFNALSNDLNTRVGKKLPASLSVNLQPESRGESSVKSSTSSKTPTTEPLSLKLPFCTQASTEHTEIRPHKPVTSSAEKNHSNSAISQNKLDKLERSLNQVGKTARNAFKHRHSGDLQLGAKNLNTHSLNVHNRSSQSVVANPNSANEKVNNKRTSTSLTLTNPPVAHSSVAKANNFRTSNRPPIIEAKDLSQPTLVNFTTNSPLSTLTAKGQFPHVKTTFSATPTSSVPSFLNTSNFTHPETAGYAKQNAFRQESVITCAPKTVKSTSNSVAMNPPIYQPSRQPVSNPVSRETSQPSSILPYPYLTADPLATVENKGNSSQVTKANRKMFEYPLYNSNVTISFPEPEPELIDLTNKSPASNSSKSPNVSPEKILGLPSPPPVHWKSTYAKRTLETDEGVRQYPLPPKKKKLFTMIEPTPLVANVPTSVEPEERVEVITLD